MRGRNKNRGRKRIPTVSAARKIDIRGMKNQDVLDRLVLRLNLLSYSGIHANRASVAHKLTKLIPDLRLQSFGQESARRFKALRWIVKESFRLIRLEKDQSVLFWLLRLAKECHALSTSGFPEYKDEAVIPRLVIFKPDVLVRAAALHMVTWSRGHSAYGPPELWDQLARCCHGILVDFRARNGKLPDKPLKSLYHYVEHNEWEKAEVPAALGVLNALFRFTDEKGHLRDFKHEMVRSKEAMGLLFDAVIAESPMKIRDSNEADECLASLLRFSRRANREYLMRQYGDELRKTFMGMDSYRLETEALHKDDVAEFFANDRALLEMVARRMTSEADREKACCLAARLLKCGLLMGDEMLQRMLGIGFLESARHIASFDIGDDYDEVDTYRAVLAAHPEWKQRFRVITQVERAISLTAQLGKTIPARVAKPADYVLE